MNLRHLEMRLERLAGGFERPTARLEQYQTPPAPVAARLLHHAAMQGGDRGKSGL